MYTICINVVLKGSLKKVIKIEKNVSQMLNNIWNKGKIVILQTLLEDDEILLVHNVRIFKQHLYIPVLVPIQACNPFMALCIDKAFPGPLIKSISSTEHSFLIVIKYHKCISYTVVFLTLCIRIFRVGSRSQLRWF